MKIFINMGLDENDSADTAVLSVFDDSTGIKHRIDSENGNLVLDVPEGFVLALAKLPDVSNTDWLNPVAPGVDSVPVADGVANIPSGAAPPIDPDEPLAPPDVDSTPAVDTAPSIDKYPAVNSAPSADVPPSA